MDNEHVAGLQQAAYDNDVDVSFNWLKQLAHGNGSPRAKNIWNDLKTEKRKITSDASFAF
jgi:hypothetical protein